MPSIGDVSFRRRNAKLCGRLAAAAPLFGAPLNAIPRITTAAPVASGRWPCASTMAAVGLPVQRWEERNAVKARRFTAWLSGYRGARPGKQFSEPAGGTARLKITRP